LGDLIARAVRACTFTTDDRPGIPWPADAGVQRADRQIAKGLDALLRASVLTLTTAKHSTANGPLMT
jgi:hypothetical protein